MKRTFEKIINFNKFNVEVITDLITFAIIPTIIIDVERGIMFLFLNILISIEKK